MQNELELNVLSALLQVDDNDTRMDYICQLDYPQMFLDKANEQIFGAIARLTFSNKSLNSLNINEALQKTGLEHKDLIPIYAMVSSPSTALEWVNQLKESKYKRDITNQIVNSLMKIQEEPFYEQYEPLKEELMAKLSGLSINDSATFISIKEYKEKILEQLGSGKDIEGFSWGLKDLDLYTSGIVQPRVYVIGGLKKAGKTRFVIYVISKLHDKKVPVAFLSMEMPGYETTKLLHASFTGLNDLRFRAGSFLRHEERIMFEDVKIDEDILGIECKSGLSKEQVISRIRKYSKMGFKVLFIDYLQRIKHNRNKQAQELEDISIAIADAARQNNIAVILLSQLNVTGEYEIPSIGMLKGSGGIGEAADTIILIDNLYRRTKRAEDKNQFDLYLEQRYGDSGVVSVVGDLGSCTFKDIVKDSN